MWNGVAVPAHLKTNIPSEREYGTEIELVKNMYVEGGSSEKIPPVKVLENWYGGCHVEVFNALIQRCKWFGNRSFDFPVMSKRKIRVFPIKGAIGPTWDSFSLFTVAFGGFVKKP